VNLVQHWLVASGMGEEEVHEAVLGEVRKAVVEKFRPKEADRIFENASTVPEWIEFMITQRHWRELLYALAEEHEDCLMLSFAIQRISDAGHNEEIACLPSASSHFTVFNGVICASLSRLIFSYAEPEFHRQLPQFLRLCSASAASYFYAQALLARLLHSAAARPHADQQLLCRATRLSQELEKHLSETVTPGERLWLRMRTALDPPGGTIASLLESVHFCPTPMPGDIIRLHELYSGENPPPAAFLRNPSVMEKLLRALFLPAGGMNMKFLPKFAYVLAYAVSVKDGRVTSEQSAGEAAVDKSQLEATREKVMTVSRLCIRRSGDAQQESIAQQLDRHLGLPVIGMGILLYVGSFLRRGTFYSSSYSSACTPVYLHLLRRIAELHSLQRPSVFAVLCDCFHVRLDLDALAALEMRRLMLDNILFLMGKGFVMPVLLEVKQWCAKTDHSLVRYFVVRLLKMSQPPYSAEFMQELLAIIAATLPAFKPEKAKATAIKFLQVCIKNKATEVQAQAALATLKNL